MYFKNAVFEQTVEAFSLIVLASTVFSISGSDDNGTDHPCSVFLKCSPAAQQRSRGDEGVEDAVCRGRARQDLLDDCLPTL